VWFFKIFIFPKKKKCNADDNKENILFFKGEPNKDLTSLLRISIKDRESGLRSSLIDGIVSWFDILKFLKA